MRLFGKDIGYDDPEWYFGHWTFMLHDTGWLISHHRIIWKEKKWPTYWTIHPFRRIKRNVTKR